MRVAICIVAMFLVGCTEVNVTQSVSPTSVSLSVGSIPDGTRATTPTPTSNGVRIELEPSSLTLSLSGGTPPAAAVVSVTVFDLATGQELTASQRGTISYSFDHADDNPLALPVATVSEVEGRWLTILGLIEDTVNLTISAAGGSAILPIAVGP